MRRTMCSACRHTGLDTFLDLGSTPIADAYTEHADDPVELYPLELAVCNKCWLVQLLEVVDHKLLFGTGYSFYTSASPPLSRYHEQYAKEVMENHGRTSVLEIGCNDGDFLRHFDEAGWSTLGIDPAAGPAAMAMARGLDVRWRPFNLAFAQDLLDMHGHYYDLIIANHVLAHVADVSDMLAGIALLLDPEYGEAIIEVQYLPDLLVNNAFDLVYHEHRNFFSFTSLEGAALRHGLYAVDAKLTSRQGGSLRVTFTKNAPPSYPWANVNVELLRSSEQWLMSSGPYEGFQGRVDRIKVRLHDLITDAAITDGSVVGYGAPAKATTLLNYCQIDHHFLDYVTDTTPAKQNRYIPGTGIKIIAPTSACLADVYLLLAWNYLPQILRKEKQFTKDGGRWIIPIPSPVLI
jgi:SAM-dependent methyltransferase